MGSERTGLYRFCRWDRGELPRALSSGDGESLNGTAEQLWHVSNVMTNEPALRLARLLTEHSFADKVFFANSGAEANEAALKLARRYAADVYGPEKSEIIAFTKVSMAVPSLLSPSAGKRLIPMVLARNRAM